MQRQAHRLIEKQTEKIIRFFSCMIETKDGKALAGAAKASSVKKCMSETQ